MGASSSSRSREDQKLAPMGRSYRNCHRKARHRRAFFYSLSEAGAITVLHSTRIEL